MALPGLLCVYTLDRLELVTWQSVGEEIYTPNQVYQFITTKRKIIRALTFTYLDFGCEKMTRRLVNQGVAQVQYLQSYFNEIKYYNNNNNIIDGFFSILRCLNSKILFCFLWIRFYFFSLYSNMHLLTIICRSFEIIIKKACHCCY